ncbi:hypothetical protein D0860_06388 [Hortaea werneckii]|uniref:BTB domain-containing protein n=1 Tax=Hortaea werneckii TaxID=91943 RepID=A0A3M7GUT8_HORWE|nr:hypothetical protein D0860_06388 [Hortaea werneckii]
MPTQLPGWLTGTVSNAYHMAVESFQGVKRKRSSSTDSENSEAKRSKVGLRARGLFRTPVWASAREDDTELLVHREVLEARAPALAQLVCRTISEDGEILILPLPPEDRRALPLVIVWLYTGVLAPRDVNADHSDPDEGERLVVGEPRTPGFSNDYAVTEEELDDARAWDDADLVAVHVFARKYGIADLEQYSLAVLLKVNERCNWTASERAVCLACESLPAHSCMIQYLAKNTFDLLLAQDEWTLPDTAGFATQYVSDLLQMSLMLRTKDKSKFSGEYFALRGDILAGLDPRRERQKLARRRTPDGWHVDFIDMFNRATTVLIGPQRSCFVVHRGILCHYSNFFNSALNGRSSEAETNSVWLEDEDTDTFERFLAWAYSSEISANPSAVYTNNPVCHTLDVRGKDLRPDRCRSPDAELLDSIEPLITRPDPNRTNQDWLREEQMLVDLYVFAHRRGIPGLRQGVIDRLLVNAELQFNTREYKVTGLQTLRSAYASLPKTSMLLKLYANEAAWLWTSDCYKHAAADTLPGGFMLDVASLTTTMRDGPDSLSKCGRSVSRDDSKVPWRKGLCEFHEHADEEAVKLCATVNGDWQRAFYRLADPAEGHSRVELV